MKSMLTVIRIFKFRFVVGLLALSFSGMALSGQIAKNSQQLTTEAWGAFNKGDFNGAIAKAKQCIHDFRDDADDKQEELKKNKASDPPLDKFTAEEREETLRRGPLNDVATSFFIIGDSEERLFQKDNDPQHNQRAKEAYTQACGYTYARCWDKGGFFWSPSKKACRRKDKL
jgi:hypothetical protein